MKRSASVAPLLGTTWMQRFLKAQIERRVHGPTPEQRASGQSLVWGRVEDDGGRWVEGNLAVPEGYLFTARSSVKAVERVLAGGIEAGAKTPTRAFGPGFLATIEGVTIEPLRRG
jgi:saccharopine dehydrogenase (NAD+, L-lysine-forming)